MKTSWYLNLGRILLLVLIALIVLSNRDARPPSTQLSSSLAPSSNASDFTVPTDGFLKRITEKPFGIFIDPKTSPVQPEKFRGYHTAADAEYGDVSGVIDVHAIADGTVVISRTATGYGGVLVINHRPTHSFYSLYGHIDPTTMPKVGAELKAGDFIGRLAPAYSEASGGERKHLHLGIINQSTPNIAGYVRDKSMLSGWIDPISLFK